MNYWFRGLPIKWKLTVLSLISTVSVLRAAGVAFFVYDQASFRRQLLKQVASLAEIVGANSTAAIIFRDEKVAEKILSTLSTERDVLCAVLYDVEDRALATYKCPLATHDVLPTLVVASGYRYSRRRLAVYVPVYLEQDRIGTVYISYSMRPVYSRLGRYAAVVLTILGCAVLVAWLLVSHLQSYVFVPITRLKNTAERITENADFKLRAEGEELDEIGALISGFNTMLDQIERRDDDLRKYQEKLRSLASQLLLTEERERRRIATGLHDSICQLLWIANMKLTSVHGKNDSAERTAEIHEVENLINSALTEARALTFQLSPPALYEFGLTDALAKLTEEVGERYGIDAVFEKGEAEKEVAEDVAVLLYRAVRELLVNTCKHASAERVSVHVTGDDGCLDITVTDDGIGFDPKVVFSRGEEGFGLFSVRERLEDIGGEMNVTSFPGMGTTVRLNAPLRFGESKSREDNKTMDPMGVGMI